MTEKQKTYLKVSIKDLTVMNEDENPYTGNKIHRQKVQLIRSIISKAAEKMRYFILENTSPINDGKYERRFESFCDLQPKIMAEHYREVADAELDKAMEEYTRPVDETGNSAYDYDQAMMNQ